MVTLRRFTILALFLLVLVGAGLLGYYGYLVTHPLSLENKFDPLIVAKAREAGLDPFLVRALVWRESKFDPDLPLGAAKERGLMQVTPAVGRAWAKVHKVDATFQDTDLEDPAVNLQVGCWYLKQALQRWPNADDPVPFALAEYNAGRSRALAWVDPANKGSHEAFEARISIQSTRSYIQVITTKRDEFEKQLSDSPSYKVPDQPLTLSPPSPTPTPSH